MPYVLVSRLWSRIRAALRKQATDPINRDWATLFGGTVGRLALGLIASILVARSLGPADFGMYVMLGAMATIGGALADLGLSAAAIRRVAEVWPADPELARQRGAVFLLARMAVAIILVLITALGAPAIATLLPGRPAPALVVLALLGIVATSLSGAISALLQAIGAFRSLALVLLANSGLTALLAVILAAAGQLTIASALGILGIATSLVSLALGWWLLAQAGGAGSSSSDVQALLERALTEVGELLRFGSWVWIANGCAMLAAYLDVLLVGRWLPAGSVGLYGLASNLAGKTDIVNQSLHTVLLPAAAQLQDARAARAFLRRGLGRSALISVILLPLFPLAEPVIGLLYGGAFAPAADTFRLLLGIALVDLWTAPLLLLVYPANRPRLLAGADVLRVATLAGVGFWLIPLLGLPGAALARLCARVAGALLILAALRRGGWVGR